MRYLHGKCQSNGVEGSGDQEDNTWVDVDCAGVDRPQDSRTHQLATLDASNHTGWQSTWKRTWSWWRHQMETFSALLALCAGNSPVPGEFPAQGPATWNIDVSFDLNGWVNGWWFETPSHSLWRHSNVSGSTDSVACGLSMITVRSRIKEAPNHIT